jgi:hypothetical protein
MAQWSFFVFMSEPLGMKIELLETNSSIQYTSRQSSRGLRPAMDFPRRLVPARYLDFACTWLRHETAWVLEHVLLCKQNICKHSLVCSEWKMKCYCCGAINFRNANQPRGGSNGCIANTLICFSSPRSVLPSLPFSVWDSIDQPSNALSWSETSSCRGRIRVPHLHSPEVSPSISLGLFSDG